MIKEFFRYTFFFLVSWVGILFCDLVAIILFTDESVNLLSEYINNTWHNFGINNIFLQHILHIFIFPILIFFIGFEYSNDYPIVIYFLIRGGVVYLTTYLLVKSIISDIQSNREKKTTKN